MVLQLEDRARVELGRIFAMTADGVENTTMPSRYIDKVWHEMLETPEDYQKFSLAEAGVIVGHSPIQGEGRVTWIPEYESRFGKLDPVWFTDENGTLQSDAFEKYLNGDEVWGSWDCGPIPTDE